MDLKSKKRLFWFFGILVFLFIVFFTLNYSLKKKIEKGLKQLPETIEIGYKDINLNSLTGNLSLNEPTIKVFGKTTDALNLKATLKSINFEGFSYWDYFTNKKIAINHLVFNQPNITYRHNDLVEKETYQKNFAKSLKHHIEIASITVNDGFVEVFQVSSDSLSLKSEGIHFNMNDIELQQTNSKPKLTFGKFNLKNGNSFFKINNYENLTLKALAVTSETLKIKGIDLNTRYSKEKLSQHIKTERDHYKLHIDSIAMHHPDIGFQDDTLYHVKSPLTTIYTPNFDVFRDKLLPDNMAYKPLYSKMLRSLNFNLGLDVVEIKNGTINYTEKVKANSGGKLVFSSLNADLKNVGNSYNEKTSIAIDAIFMEHTPLNVQWNFDVKDQNDTFIFKSEIGTFQAETLNQYMTSNLNVKLEGEVERLYFTISGNDNVSNIDAKLKYDDFDVIILKENGEEKNKFLSTVLNIFISKDSKGDGDPYRYGSEQGIERNKTKSIFSFTWDNLKAALMNAIMGNGKKPE